eukprot:6209480-Pleurochrysis_carterae.AAC.3
MMWGGGSVGGEQRAMSYKTVSSTVPESMALFYKFINAKTWSADRICGERPGWSLLVDLPCPSAPDRQQKDRTWFIHYCER